MNNNIINKNDDDDATNYNFMEKGQYIQKDEEVAGGVAEKRNKKEEDIQNINQPAQRSGRGDFQAVISVYEAGLDVASPDLDPHENFVNFQTKVSGQYDSMIKRHGFKLVNGAGTREEQESTVHSYVDPFLKSKNIPRLYRTNLFDKTPIADGQRITASYKGRDGLHWYFRTMTLEMRKRLCQLMDLSRTPRVFLHGNPHILNFAKFSNGAAMIDFDRACVGPYVWDLVRLLVSVVLRQDSESEFSGPFLRAGVVDCLKRGYEWGLLHTDQPPKQMISNQPFEPLNSSASSPSTSDDLRNAEELFYEKRLLEMRSHRVEANSPTILAMAEAFLMARTKSLSSQIQNPTPSQNQKWTTLGGSSSSGSGSGSGGKLVVDGEEYQIVEASASKNWNGRVRTLIMLSQTSPQAPQSKNILVDIKPVFKDADDEFFTNPYKPDYAKRMLVALQLYGESYVQSPSIFELDGIQYFAHQVPTFKKGIQRPLTEDDQRDFFYAVGTQLGHGHGLAVQDDQNISHILFHLNSNWTQMIEVASRLRDEITAAYRRYLTLLPPA